MKIMLVRLKCLRCGHPWVPTQSVIRMCPKCKSVHWQTRKVGRQGLRPQKKDEKAS